jgi:hypothetical protein
MGKMKHEMEENSGGVASKHVKELKKLPTLKELGKINFMGYTDGSISIFDEGRRRLGKESRACQN